ncbi:hypothetical protein ACX0HA_11060 [Flavobacterium hauense]
MKNVFLVFLFSVSISGFCQAEKDSLVLTDTKAILDKLDLMFYLDHVASEYVKMTKEQQKESDKTFLYYFENTIVKNNPSSLDLAEFIGSDHAKYNPVTWKNFCEDVHQKNLNEFVAMTEKYGYLSNKRLNRLKGGKVYSLVIFVVRDDAQDKKVKRLIKQEKKNGNMPQVDYDMFKLFLERKKVFTDYDIARFEKSGGKIIKETP